MVNNTDLEVEFDVPQIIPPSLPKPTTERIVNNINHIINDKEISSGLKLSNSTKISSKEEIRQLRIDFYKNKFKNCSAKEA